MVFSTRMFLNLNLGIEWLLRCRAMELGLLRCIVMHLERVVVKRPTYVLFSLDSFPTDIWTYIHYKNFSDIYKVLKTSTRDKCNVIVTRAALRRTDKESVSRTGLNSRKQLSKFHHQYACIVIFLSLPVITYHRHLAHLPNFSVRPMFSVAGHLYT